jgi:hypothetical protein
MPPLDQPLQSMSNEELLRYYYTLRDASGDKDRDIAAMQSMYWAGNLLGNAIVQEVYRGEGKAIRARMVDVRLELERRGWTPAKGLSEMSGAPSPLGAPGTRALLGNTVESRDGVTTAPGLQVQSKYMFNAERYAKENGCGSPVTAMNLRTPTAETFTIACTGGETLIVFCEYGDCRAMK